MKTTFEIKYPNNKTYWIFWEDNLNNFVYGSTDVTQVTTTTMSNYWTTLDESEWIQKLETDFNTNISF